MLMRMIREIRGTGQSLCCTSGFIQHLYLFIISVPCLFLYRCNRLVFLFLMLVLFLTFSLVLSWFDR